MNHTRSLYLNTVFLFLSVYSLTTQATILNFNLRQVEFGSVLDGSSSANLTIDNLTATFTSLPDSGIDSVFNHTSTRFGINSLGSGADSPSLIDAGAGWSEFLSIKFNMLVSLREIVLSAFGTSEQAFLGFGQTHSVLLSGMSASVDSYQFSDWSIPAGTSLLLSHVKGNGFSFDRILLEAVEVDEPPILMLLFAGLLSMSLGLALRTLISP